MAKKTESSKRDVKLLILFTVLGAGTVILFSTTDIITLFSVTGLTLDATNSKGNASDRGVEASTGHSNSEASLAQPKDKDKGNKFKEPRAPKEPKCRSPTNPRCQVNPSPTPIDISRPTPSPDCIGSECIPLPQTVTLIDLRGQVARIEPYFGGGALSSSVIEEGVPEFIRDKVIVHDRFHTSANGQTVTGSLKLEWGHGLSITVQQFLVPNEFYDWFEVKLPQIIRGDGFATFDGVSEGEFVYKFTVPNDLIDKNNVIPVRLIINTQDAVVDGFADIELERPVQEAKTFSVAEWFRSIFTEFRIRFA